MVPPLNGVSKIRNCMFEWTLSIGRKVGIPKGILPLIRQGLQIRNPDNSLSHPGHFWESISCRVREAGPLLERVQRVQLHLSVLSNGCLAPVLRNIFHEVNENH